MLTLPNRKDLVTADVNVRPYKYKMYVMYPTTYQYFISF
jgi:hypothetical protein